MKFLITGCAGFIGFSIAQKLLKKKGNFVIGTDILSKYYSVTLKRNRLKILEMAPKNDWLKKLKYLEVKSHLVDLLNRQDKMLMASSIEGRVPFLDVDLVTSCFQIEPEQSSKNIETKPQLKIMLSKYFDYNFVYRPKIGFRIPFNEWIVLKKWNDYLSIVLEPSLKKIFGNKFCDDLYGKVINKEDIDLNAKYVWLLINLFFWKKIFKMRF